MGLLLSLCACGDEPAPPAEPGAAPPARPKVEVFETPRFFVQVGSEGHVSASFGKREDEGAFLAAGELSQGSADARAAALGALRQGLFDTLGQEGLEPPVLLLRAGPGVPWIHIAALLDLALDPEIDLPRLDLRLPWDEQPQRIEFASRDPGTPALRIDIAGGESAKRTRVLVGKSGTFELVSGDDEAERKAHMEAISGLRSALQGFASTWKQPERRAQIHVADPANAPYIHVLAVIRICREKGFETITLGDAEPSAVK